MRLRTKLVILVVLAALLPALVLAGLSLGVVRRLADLAGEQSRAAMEQEARQRLVGRAVDLVHIHARHSPTGNRARRVSPGRASALEVLPWKRPRRPGMP